MKIKLMEKLEEIKKHLSILHITKMTFEDLYEELSEPTFVLWVDNKGNIHDDPIIGVEFNGKELSLLVDDRDHFNSVITLYESDFADNIDWLESIYNNIQELLQLHPELINKFANTIP